MSLLADAETQLRAQRYGAKTARAMRNVLAMASPPGFKIEIAVRGLFSSSSTSSHTNASALDDALREVVEARLDSLLADALDVLADREAKASDALLRLALAAALTPTGDAQ